MADETTPPWATQLVEKLNSITFERVTEICSIIQKLGLNEEDTKGWIDIIDEQIDKTYTAIIDDAVDIQNKFIDTIEELLKKASGLCDMLHVQMPQYGSEDLSLLEARNMLQQKVTELEVVVNARKKECDKLAKRQLEVCKTLDIEPKILSACPLPSKTELEELERHIEALEEERFNRESRFLDVKYKLLEIVHNLGVKPSLELEKIVCSPDDSLFMVTDHNMKWLDEYYESLVKQKQDTMIEIERLQERVRSLWEMLSEDIKVCNEFVQRDKGHLLQTLEAWRSEFRRCEKLKKANIEKFVKELRHQLEKLWEQCHFTSSQREEFDYFHCDLYTEDLLSFHDIEINRLKKYYEDNKEIFSLLVRREQYWNKMIELEESASAPNRFKNRGGTLLKEEKERNSLKKKIPELEERLKELAMNYETRTGRQFLSWGETIFSLIEKSHKNYESDKKFKLSARKTQRDLAPTPGKSTIGLSSMMSGSKANLMSGSKANLLSGSRKNLNTLLLTPQVASSTKRKPLTPLFTTGKKLKVANPQTKTPIPKLKINDQTMKRRSRSSTDRKKRLDKIRRISKTMDSKKRKVGVSSDPNTTTTNYDVFEKEVFSKGACSRSTVFDVSTLATPLPLTPRSKCTPDRGLMRTKTSTMFSRKPGPAIDI